MGFELTEDVLREVARLPVKSRSQAMRLIGKMEFQKCAEDPIYWLDASKHVKTPRWPGGMPYVFTYDPHPLYECKECKMEVLREKRVTHLEIAHKVRIKSIKELNSTFTEMSHVRPFTVMDYMPPIVEVWEKSQLMAVEKSRDMMATWLIVALFTWDTLFHFGRQHIFQSDDAPKSLELVQRVNIMYENQPKFLKDAVGRGTFSKGGSRSGEFFIREGTEHSEILGFPQGPDQIRYLHPSGVFQDEAAFQTEAGAAFAAIKPAIQAGGKFVAISSANRSYFELICRDKTDE